MFHVAFGTRENKLIYISPVRTVYPQAILVFIITLMYSVISPLILVFGAIYFGMGYLVYKYKLLFGKLFARFVPL